MRALRNRRLSAGELWEAGYLPLHAACEALNCTPGELKGFVRDRVIRCRAIAPGFTVYEVPKGTSR